MTNLSFAVLGLGGIGGFISAMLLKNNYSVIGIAKTQCTSVPLQLRSRIYGSLDATLPTCYELTSTPDVLFIAVKSYDLKTAISQVDPKLVSNSAIIPLLNGLGHSEVLRERFGNHVATGTIGAIESTKSKSGHIAHTSTQVPLLEIASESDLPITQLSLIADSICGTGIQTNILRSENEVIWRKLVRLNAIASTTAAAQQSLGFVRRSDYWNSLLEKTVQEATQIAKAHGVQIEAAAVNDQISALSGDLTTSLQRDVANGHAGETEAITGSIIAQGLKMGIDTPATCKLYDLIIGQVTMHSNKWLNNSAVRT